MTGRIAFEALTNVSDGLITEAAEKLGLLNSPASATAKSPRRKGSGTISRFLNSGWGVALLCVVMSVGVLSGIIWAGQRQPTGGPVQTEPETETVDYSGESQDEVTVQHGDTVIYPRKFFLYSSSNGSTADGMGFAREIELYDDNTPVLPKVYYDKDGSISPCELHLTTGYEFSYVRVYDTDMRAVGYTYDGAFNYKAFLSALPVGRYYVALQIKHNSSVCEYAYELVVVNTAEVNTDTEPPVEEIISEEKAKEIASAYWDIRDGDRDSDTDFEFRIECHQKTAVTSRGETVYVILLRWFVDGQHWSTVATVWVDCVTGEVIIPYEDLDNKTETVTESHDPV